MRVGAAYTQTGVLAKGRAKGSAGEIEELGRETLTFDFCLRTSIPVLTTSTYVVAWPQGDQFLGGDL